MVDDYSVVQRDNIRAWNIFHVYIPTTFLLIKEKNINTVV